MSFQALNAASPIQGISPTEKSVLNALANRAGENGTCFPSQRRIAMDTCLNVRSVRRSLAALETLGFIERVEQRRPGGGRTADLYHLQFMQSGDHPNGTGRPDMASATPGHSVRTSPDTQAGLKPSSQSSKKPRDLTVLSAADATDVRPAPEKPSPTKRDLDAIWNAAPLLARRRSSFEKMQAAVKLASRAGHSPAAILAGLREFWQSDDNTRDDGAFVQGLHISIKDHRWAQHVAPPGAKVSPADWPAEKWAPILGLYRSEGFWRASLGPKPGEPGCLVPQHVPDDWGNDPAKWSETRWRYHLADYARDGSWRCDLGPKPGEPGCNVPARLLIGTAA